MQESAPAAGAGAHSKAPHRRKKGASAAGQIQQQVRRWKRAIGRETGKPRAASSSRGGHTNAFFVFPSRSRQCSMFPVLSFPLKAKGGFLSRSLPDQVGPGDAYRHLIPIAAPRPGRRAAATRHMTPVLLRDVLCVMWFLFFSCALAR